MLTNKKIIEHIRPDIYAIIVSTCRYYEDYKKQRIIKSDNPEITVEAKYAETITKEDFKSFCSNLIQTLKVKLEVKWVAYTISLALKGRRGPEKTSCDSANT